MVGERNTTNITNSDDIITISSSMINKWTSSRPNL